MNNLQIPCIPQGDFATSSRINFKKMRIGFAEVFLARHNTFTDAGKRQVLINGLKMIYNVTK